MDRPERFFSAAQLEQLSGMRRVSLIIVGALIFGMITFGGMLSSMVDWGEATWDLSLESPITVLALAGAGIGILVSQVITMFIHQKTPMAGDAPTDSEVYSANAQFNTELIVRSVLVEGPGFFCLLALMIGQNYWALVGAGVCLFFLILKLPNESRHLHDIHQRLHERT